MNVLSWLKFDNIEVLDVGARGGLRAFWSHFLDDKGYSYLLKHKRFIATAIEADSNEIEKLLKSNEYKNVEEACLYSESKEMEIYMTADGGARSSLLEPDIEEINKHRKLIDKGQHPFTVERKIAVKTRTLSSLFENQFFDWIKVDTQGVEFEVLKGGEDITQRAICIFLEVQTAPLYKGQKLRVEVDNLLESQGFDRVITTAKPHIPVEQDAVYLKSLKFIYDRIEFEKYLITCICLGLIDELKLAVKDKASLLSFSNWIIVKFYILTNNIFLNENFNNYLGRLV